MKNKKLYTYYLNVTRAEGVFVEKTHEMFTSLLTSNYHDIYMLDDKIDGFIIISYDNEKYYITMLYGNDTAKKELLHRFIDNKHPDALWIHFFNPDALSWYPKPNIEHPCFQGVGDGSAMFDFYLQNGFTIHSTQETYFKSLDTFFYPSTYQSIKLKHLDQDITYAYYQPDVHEGFVDLFDDLKAPHWKNVMHLNDQLMTPLPVCVALKLNRVIGFAGPLKVEDSLRGYFAGIGVSPYDRGQKIGHVLFFELCQRLKDLGASYMTLFTGANNPARYLYQHAGFEVISKQHTMVLLLLNKTSDT